MKKKIFVVISTCSHAECAKILEREAELYIKENKAKNIELVKVNNYDNIENSDWCELKYHCTKK